MGSAVTILVILILLYLAGYMVLVAIGTVLKPLVNFDWGASMVNNIGRKKSHAQVADYKAEYTVAADTERHLLENYEPMVVAIQPARQVEFYSALHPLPKKWSPPPLVSEVRDLLRMANEVPYAPIISSYVAPSAYPDAPPRAPSPIQPPPKWTALSEEIAEPSFQLPLYKGLFKFLNGFVRAAHAYESKKHLENMERWQKEKLARAHRNSHMRELEKKAHAAYRSAQSAAEASYSEAFRVYRAAKEDYLKKLAIEKAELEALLVAHTGSTEADFLVRWRVALEHMSLPGWVPRAAQYSLKGGVLIHEHEFPDVVAFNWSKIVSLKAGNMVKPVSKQERERAIADVWPSLCLRLSAEAIRLDSSNLLRAVVINGWINYVDQSNGQRGQAFVVSMFAERSRIEQLQLEALDPVTAFKAIKGRVTFSYAASPVQPIMRLDSNDARFVDAKEILSRTSVDSNLAIMNWEDFEHLCRELFERIFSDSGAEVRVTRASRDHGVDAIVLDPDPIRGGKIVIQAKRYTSPVDVSSVRDLYGAVINEGAVKGILVTTSSFGPDSYEFAKSKPLSLISGPELLGLLEKHGYRYRIDLEEARAALAAQKQRTDR